MNDAQIIAEAIAKLDARKENYPVCAILAIDNNLVGTEYNSVQSDNDWTAHAESKLLRQHAADIRSAVKSGKNVTIYTTLEPCLMCVGTAILSRVHRIVFSCPDPHGGATKLNVAGTWYEKKWPIIEGGIQQEESRAVLMTYMKNHLPQWQSVLDAFEKL